NSAGNSSPSAVSNAVTPAAAATAPGPPTSVNASPGNARATVSFAAPTDNGGSVVTGYTVTSNPGGLTTKGTGSPLTVLGLANGTPYTFSAVATNAVGNSIASAPSNQVTPIAPSKCGFPSIPAVTVNGYGRSIAVGDFNADGNPDFALANSPNDT